MARERKGNTAREFTGGLEFLKTLVEYNLDTGEVTTSLPYNVRPRIQHTGYRMLKLPVTSEGTGKERRTAYFRVDHLAWYLAVGYWPHGHIEHLNGLLWDDSIDNLVHREPDGKRWWYGPQPGTAMRYLVEIEGDASSNTPLIDIYQEGENVVAKPRPSEGWLSRTKQGPVLSVEEDTTQIGEFGKDWL